MNRINSGDMPPDEDKAPKPDDIARVAEWIAGQLHEAEAARQASGSERVAFRKLSREEYANTIRDLLGVTFDVNDPTGLPEDPDWQGFQRIGSVLTLSPAHVEKYLAAAESVLDEALSLGPEPKREVITWTPVRHAREELPRKNTRRAASPTKCASISCRTTARSTITPSRSRPPAITSCASSSAACGPRAARAPRLRLYAGDLSRMLFEQDVDAPEDQPATIEFRAHLPAGKHPIRIVNAVPGPNPEARRSRASGTPNHLHRPARAACRGRSSSPTTTASRSCRSSCSTRSSGTARSSSRGRRRRTSASSSAATRRPKIPRMRAKSSRASPSAPGAGRCTREEVDRLSSSSEGATARR